MLFSRFCLIKNKDIGLSMRVVFLIWILINSVLLYGKEKPAPFIKRILSHNGPVLVFNFQPSVNELPLLKIKDLPATFQFSGQGITKNNKGLFLNHIGTGRIYQWIGDAEWGEWKRIDSTIFTAYNFLSLFFSVDSSIYSYGGTGFWLHNGNLRKYNFSAKEWKAKLLNTSIPWLREPNELFFIDTSTKKLYFNGEGKLHDASLKEGVVDSSSISMMYCLDIEQGEVVEMGNYQINIAGFFGQTPWGTITTFNKLADFAHNEYYTLSEQVENNLFRILAKSNSNHLKWQYSFWLDSALYFSNSNYEYDSVIIHKSDLKKAGFPVYSPLEKTKQTGKNGISPMVFVLTCIVLGSLNIFFFIKYNKHKKDRLKHTFNESINRQDPELNKGIKLSEVEIGLMRLIFENSILKKMTQINDINNILGCSNKNIDIQKRLRSDAINALNDKLCILLLTDQKVISRKRSAFDGRSFEYFIDQQFFTAIQKLQNSSASS